MNLFDHFPLRSRAESLEYVSMLFPHSEYLEALIRLLYPAVCGACSRLLELEEKNLCMSCSLWLEEQHLDAWESLQDIQGSGPGGLDNAWALYDYESPVREIIGQLKFSGKRWLLKPFIPALSKLSQTLLAEYDYDAVVPLPADPHRKWTREYNLAELLARQIAKNLNLPLLCMLKKRFSTPAQSRLSRLERSLNLWEAFELINNAPAIGKRILLVDDILTTGATASEAARALKKGGAYAVDIVSLARTNLQGSRIATSKNEGVLRA